MEARVEHAIFLHCMFDAMAKSPVVLVLSLLIARQGGSVCVTTRWEPSRCSSPTWRRPLVCFSRWLSATPTCWRSTANSSAQHSGGGTATSWPPDARCQSLYEEGIAVARKTGNRQTVAFGLEGI